MPVDSVITPEIYLCNGIQTAFPIPFIYLEDSFVWVRRYNSATMSNSTLVLGVDYTIESDTVNTVSAYPTGDTLTLSLQIPLKQLVDLEREGRIDADVLDYIHDKLTLIAQQLNLDVESLIGLEVPEVPVPSMKLPGAAARANKYLAFNADGDVVVVTAIDTGVVSVTPFGEALVGMPGAVEARDLLGVAYLTSPETVALNNTMSIAVMQAAIDAVPKNLNGFGLTISFAAGAYTLASALTIDQFYNGTVTIDLSGSTSITASGASAFSVHDCWKVAITGGTLISSYASASGLFFKVYDCGYFSWDNGTFSYTGASTFNAPVKVLRVKKSRCEYLTVTNDGAGSINSAVTCSDGDLFVGQLSSSTGLEPSWAATILDGTAYYDEAYLFTGTSGVVDGDITSLLSGPINSIEGALQDLDDKIIGFATGTWTVRTAAATNQWYDVCWSPELKLFCAVGDLGSGNRVMTSPHGVEWTARSSAFDARWTAVCWSPELSLFCSVSPSPTIPRLMTSPDGIVWTLQTIPTGAFWIDVCWSPELSLFCAVSTDPDGAMTSPDGVNWTQRTTPLGGGGMVTWSPELSLFCAVGSGTNALTSPDGITWTTVILPENYGWADLCWSPKLGLFCLVGTTASGNKLLTSPDGSTWTAISSPIERGWNAVCWSPELEIFCALGSTGTVDNVMISRDGITWATRDTNKSLWQSICWSPERGIFCGVSTSTSDAVVNSFPVPPL